jgi:hypothetical protein
MTEETPMSGIVGRADSSGKRRVVITTINDLHACSLCRRVAPLLLW